MATIEIDPTLSARLAAVGEETGEPLGELVSELLAEALAGHAASAGEPAARAVAEERRRLHEKKARFLGSMAHELRTPLSSVLILADLLADDPAGSLGDKQLEYVRKIRTAAADMMQLINQVQELAKLETGRIEAFAETVALPDLIRQVEREFRGAAQEKGVPFVVELAGLLPAEIRTDRKRLRQILRTLLGGALRHTEEGRILLRVSAVPGGPGAAGEEAISLAVSDTGKAIPAAQRETIFEALAQADLRSSRDYGGMDLGLAIARQLARLLGGDLTLACTGTKGNTFTVVLPVAGPAAGQPSPVPAAK